MVRTTLLLALALLAGACGLPAPTPVFRLVPPAVAAIPSKVPAAADLAPRLSIAPSPLPSVVPSLVPSLAPVPVPITHPRFPLLRTGLGRATITVVDAVTGEPVGIGSPPPWAGPGLPHVSADGRWLVYMGYGTMDTRLILWDLDAHVALTPAGLATGDQREPDVDAKGASLIYFTGASYAPELAVCDVATGLERRLALPKDLVTGAHSPSVSSDGRRAAYAMTGRRGDTNLVVLDVATGRPITPAALNSPDDDDDPALSPDGATLLFATNRNGSRDVYACNLATGACSEPAGVNTVSDETRPRFLGADGRELAWVSTRDGSERAYARALSTGGMQ
ncbi:MAG: amidohydrolase [Cyanobacteria bacterium RYN_339]|nr:amidohydrolase [Cyanobacteria bacterium RYN_339]